MNVQYDPEVDAMYIQFGKGKVVSTRALDDSRNIDLGEDGQAIGVELLGVSRGVATEDLPERQAIEAALAKLGVKIAA